MASTGRWTALAAVAACLTLAARSEAAVSQSTCAAIGGAQNEPLAESVILGLMRSRGTIHSPPRRVRIGGPPFAPIYADVETWVSNPHQLNITCAASTFTLRMNVRAKISKSVGSITRHGTAAVRGAYVILSAPRRVCPRGITLVMLNLVDIPTTADGWIRDRINSGSPVRIPCQRL